MFKGWIGIASLLTILGVGLGTGIAAAFYWNRLTSVETADVVTTPDSVVVQQLQQVGELVTAKFTADIPVQATSDRTVAGVSIGTTELTYMARGEVAAGIDFSAITAENITVDGATLTVVLPPTTILDKKIDVTESEVVAYNRGTLGLGPDRAPELQDEAENEALMRLVGAACDGDILTLAQKKAEEQFAALFSGFQFEAITIQSASNPNQVCRGDSDG